MKDCPMLVGCHLVLAMMPSGPMLVGCHLVLAMMPSGPMLVGYHLVLAMMHGGNHLRLLLVRVRKYSSLIILNLES
jgi:hypothetical protein